MKIAFIWPSDYSAYETVPLSLGILYDRIRDKGHDVRLFNLSLEGWAADAPELLQAIGAFQPDLVALTAWPTTAASAFVTARAIHPLLPDATFLMGGTYATLNAKVAYDKAGLDYVLCGEAERTFPQFVDLLAAGDRDGIAELPGIYFRRPDGTVVHNTPVRHADLDNLGEVDWEFVELNRYLGKGYMRTALGEKRKGPVIATRGCPYSCQFCTVPLVNGKATRRWSVEYVTRQIRRLYEDYGVRHINFMDDNPSQDIEHWKEVCRAIADMALPGLVLENHRGTRLERMDPEMLRLMKKAGFKHIVIAPESGSDEVRSLMKKSMSTTAVFEAARMIREAGLGLHGFFLVGYPGETREQRHETYRFIRALKFDAFKIHKFLALPGTAAFHSLVGRGLVEETYSPVGYLLGNTLPNYNGDDPALLDREILTEYLRFYLTRPWKSVHVLRMAPPEMLWRALSGMVRGAATFFLSRLLPGGRGGPRQLPAEATAPEAASSSADSPLQSTSTFCVGAGVAAEGEGSRKG